MNLGEQLINHVAQFATIANSATVQESIRLARRTAKYLNVLSGESLMDLGQRVQSLMSVKIDSESDIRQFNTFLKALTDATNLF